MKAGDHFALDGVRYAVKKDYGNIITAYPLNLDGTLDTESCVQAIHKSNLSKAVIL